MNRAEWRRWYSTDRWKRIRRERLAREPLCRMCLPKRVEPARIVDHVKPHKGDAALFFCVENTQSLCKHHHDKWKQAAERSTATPIGEDGWPLTG